MIGVGILLVRSTKAETLTIYVRHNIPRDNAMLDSNTEIINPFRKSKVPIAKPNTPVVKRSMITSSILIIVRINADDKYTRSPSEMLVAAAIAMGKVLNGLKANPMEGKNTGADWNITVNAINRAPLQTNLLGFRSNNITPPIYF